MPDQPDANVGVDARDEIENSDEPTPADAIDKDDPHKVEKLSKLGDAGEEGAEGAE
jgi:hypothetical protein